MFETCFEYFQGFRPALSSCKLFSSSSGMDFRKPFFIEDISSCPEPDLHVCCSSPWTSLNHAFIVIFLYRNWAKVNLKLTISWNLTLNYRLACSLNHFERNLKYCYYFETLLRLDSCFFSFVRIFFYSAPFTNSYKLYKENLIDALSLSLNLTFSMTLLRNNAEVLA